MIVEIDSANSKGFFGLAPEEELQMIGRDPDYFGFAYVDDPDSPPLGAIVFSIELEEGEGSEDGVEHPVLVIRSIYVLEEYRQQNIAVILFANLREIAKECGADAIRADVPMGREYDTLCDVLDNFGFEFFITELFEITVRLSEICSLDTFRHNKTSKAVPVRKITQNVFGNFFYSISPEKSISQYSLSDQKSDYDEDISCIIEHAGKPQGIFLVKSLPNGIIRPTYLRIKNGAEPKYGLQLLVSALNEANKKYPLDTKVHVKCIRKITAIMINYFFPEMRPLLVRRGYYYL